MKINKIIIIATVLLGVMFLAGCDYLDEMKQASYEDECFYDVHCQAHERCFEGHCEEFEKAEAFWVEKVNETINESNMPLNISHVGMEENETFDFGLLKDRDKPKSETIPDDYEKITIYATVCTHTGMFSCNMSNPPQCTPPDYCYNESKEMWFPRRSLNDTN